MNSELKHTPPWALAHQSAVFGRAKTREPHIWAQKHLWVQILYVLLLSISIFLAGTSLASHTARAAPDNKQAERQNIFILDASGSMWGRIEKKIKITVVRESFSQFLQNNELPSSLGLMAYGHRSRGRCKDVQLLLPPGQHTKQAFLKKLNSVKPLGKTPIALALAQAGQNLGAGQNTSSSTRSASIILLSDGAENCRQDPCAQAKQLKSQMPALTIHVIGLGILSQKAQQQLSCVARAGSGRFVHAQSQKELTNALNTTLAENNFSFSAKKNKSNLPPPPKLQPVFPGLSLKGFLDPQKTKTSEDLTWYIYRIISKTDPARKGRALISQYSGAAPKVKLPDGDYYIEARYGRARGSANIKIKQHQAQQLALIINAGAVFARATAEAGGEVLENMHYALYRLPNKTDLKQRALQHLLKSATLIENYYQDEVFARLPIGTYLLIAHFGMSQKYQLIKLAPGDVSDLTLNMSFGHVRLSTSLPNANAPLQKVSYRLYQVQDIKSDARNMREIRYLAAAQPELNLPAGHYEVVAQAGLAAKRRAFTLKEGEQLAIDLTLNAAELTLKAARKNSDRPLSDRPLEEHISFRIYALNQKQPASPKALYIGSQNGENIVLPAGDYRITASYGQNNVFAAQKITLAPGKAHEAKLAIEGIKIALRLQDKTGEPIDKIRSMRLFNNKGEELTRTASTKPQFILSPGQYKLEIHWKNKIYRRALNISAQSSPELAISLN